MVNYPEVQQKAQEEIDRVVGQNRLPTFEDRDSLPYVFAVFKETLRWHNVAPLGNLIDSILFSTRINRTLCRTRAFVERGRRLQRILVTSEINSHGKHMVSVRIENDAFSLKPRSFL